MKAPEIERAKVHGPYAVVDFLEADVLIGEDVADVYPVGVPANAPLRLTRRTSKWAGYSMDARRSEEGHRQIAELLHPDYEGKDVAWRYGARDLFSCIAFVDVLHCHTWLL